VKLAAQLIIEEALESAVEAQLGRGYYDRGGVGGQRNGDRRGQLDTAEGRIEYAMAQVCGIAGWSSAVRKTLSGRSEELKRLAIEMFARELSVRDFEAAFVDEVGRGVLSKISVSAVAERLHLVQPREAVLAGWGITTGATRCCSAFCRDRRRIRPHARSF